jgi:hypothetical protein
MIPVTAARLATLLGGCGDDGIIAPLIAEFRAKLTGEGGIAGHVVMCFEGACREDDALYAQLRRCG